MTDSKYKITISSCYNFESGYKTLLLKILSGLDLEKIEIYPRSYTSVSPDFAPFFYGIDKKKIEFLFDLLILPASNFFDTTHPIFHIAPHKNRHMFTMWESSRINDLFIDQLNKMNGIIVPNNWNKTNFKNQGCQTKIKVIPLFVDTDFYFYNPPPSFDNFIFATGNDDFRKRTKKVINCFLKAFPTEKDVFLKVKTKDKNMKFLDPRIIPDAENHSSMNEWYWKSHVFVSGASAEGWGFMQHESMACGRPVISPKYAGVAEFLNETNGYCVDFDEVLSEGYWKCAEGKWSMFDEDHMIETMRYCYHNREDTRNRGIIASRDACQFSGNRFLNNIRQYIIDFS